MTSARFCSGLARLLFAGLALSSLAQQPMQTKFRTTGQSMIVVPVMINGAGPFDFQLDTGCSLSVVDQKLAEELHLPLTGKAVLDTAQSEAVTTVAHVDSVRMGEASAAGLDVIVADRSVDLLFKVRGVLGEDFLQHFDVLIDNRHHVIQLERGAGPLGNMLGGERLQLSSVGSGGEQLDPNRLVIVGRFEEMRDREAKLQLDSGAPYLLLFSQVEMPDPANQPATFPVTGVLKGSFAAYVRTLRLRLGKRFFSDVTAAVPAEPVTQRNVAGLLPTSMFRSIFISHSARFVILNPSVSESAEKQDLARSKTPLAKEDASDMWDE